MAGFCPISHIPLAELKMAVVFKGETKVVYDAEHLVHWLCNYKLQNPMTNEIVSAWRVCDILVPFRLPHMDEGDLKATASFLSHQNAVWWRSLQCVSQECFGLSMCLIVWISGFYGLVCLTECSIDALENEETRLECIFAPVTLFFIQLLCVVCMFWVFPELRLQQIVRQTVVCTLVMFFMSYLISILLCMYFEKDELISLVKRFLVWFRHGALLVRHSRVLALLDRLLRL